MYIATKSFESESYSCRKCKTKDSEVKFSTCTWRCDICDKKILIDIGEQHRLVRLLPSEMTKYDSVYDRYSKKLYGLKGIIINGERYILGVEGRGGVTVDRDEFVNCMWNDQ